MYQIYRSFLLYLSPQLSIDFRLSTVSERDAAKSAATNVESNDPELQSTLNVAHDFQIALVKEKNRHQEEQTRIALGIFGKVLGGERNAPIVVASFAALLGFLFAGACLFLAANSPDSNDFYSDWSERTLAITTLALGFIFGKKSS